VDLELHDAAVRAAIAGGRLASLSAAADTDNIAWVRDLWALANRTLLPRTPTFSVRKAQTGYGPLSATRRGSGWSS
jgi:hypothetical protein